MDLQATLKLDNWGGARESETYSVLRVPPTYSPVYGDSSIERDEYMIEPPSHDLEFGGGAVVDRIGRNGRFTGGSGGDLVSIDNMENVSYIGIFVGQDYDPGDVIGRLIFYFKDGNYSSVGQNQGHKSTKYYRYDKKIPIVLYSPNELFYALCSQHKIWVKT